MSKKIIGLIMATILVSGCTNTNTPVDLTKSISKNELLYYESYENSSYIENPTLVVYLSGDTGNRGGLDSRYMFSEAKLISRKYNNVIGVSVLRPGTFDKLGNRSPGYQDHRDDNKTNSNIGYVAKTIKHLKQKYNANSIIAVGHSGGAMTLGVIIGQYPNLLDAVVLTSTVCDIPVYRRNRGRSLWPRSLSPKNFIESIPSTTVIRLVTGKNDSNTKPRFAEECEDIYKDRGLSAELILVDGATHRFSTVSNTVSNVVDTLLR